METVERRSNQSLAVKRPKVVLSTNKYRMSISTTRMQISAATQNFATTATRSCLVDPATI